MSATATGHACAPIFDQKTGFLRVKKKPDYSFVGPDLPFTNILLVRPELRPLPPVRQGQSLNIITGVSFTAERRWRPRSPSPAAGQRSAGLAAPGQQRRRYTLAIALASNNGGDMP